MSTKMHALRQNKYPCQVWTYINLQTIVCDQSETIWVHDLEHFQIEYYFISRGKFVLFDFDFEVYYSWFGFQIISE